MFLIDNNLPPDLVNWFFDQEVQAVHVRALGLASSDDREIWRYAAANDLAIVTKDRDFDHYFEKAQNAQISVYRLLIGNATKTALYEWLEDRISLFQDFRDNSKGDLPNPPPKLYLID
jgi:predicted nuclease of predicted toxin-antitoxin system